MTEINLFPVEERRDMLGTACLVCNCPPHTDDGAFHPEHGVYRERSDGQVQCSVCGDIIPRWRSKKQILEHAAKANDSSK